MNRFSEVIQWGITSYQSDWSSSKSLQTINAGKGVEKKGTLPYCWWESNLVQTLWRTVWRFLKTLSGAAIGLPTWLSGKELACQCRGCGFSHWVRKIPWRRKWQPTPIFLPGKSHGQRSLAGYSAWGRKVGHNLVTKQQSYHMIQ